MIDQRPIVVSFSGGKSSAMMCDLLETLPEYRDRVKHYVFANTGRELPATISFMRWWGKYLNREIVVIEAVVHHDERKSSTHKVIRNLTSELSMDGQPFEEVMKKYGLPSITFLHCTRELKANPIRSYIRQELGLNPGEYVQAIGMRFDEPRRVKQDPEFIYPLYEQRITKQDVNEFFAHPDRKNFTLDIEEFEGNCDFCFKKSWAKLEKMRAKHPTRIMWWTDMEDRYWEESSESYRGHRMAYDLLQGKHRNDIDLPCHCLHSEL
jgi:3'-phosphoadenosine 5'-phosphosulfate sulfotransferase (PAPS reductase)/FAD synthetase